jgi:hypothetical protein
VSNDNKVQPVFSDWQVGFSENSAMSRVLTTGTVPS